jgi:hypothetical protein
MDYTNNEIPVFDGQNYEIWSSRMKSFLEAWGYDVWYLIVTGYTASNKLMKTASKKELKRNIKIAMDVILDGLPNSVKIKVG